MIGRPIHRVARVARYLGVSVDGGDILMWADTPMYGIGPTVIPVGLCAKMTELRGVAREEKLDALLTKAAEEAALKKSYPSLF